MGIKCRQTLQVLLLSLAAGGLSGTAARANTVVKFPKIVPLSEQVRSAEQIVRGVIVAAERLEYRSGADYGSCGTRYRMRVTESLRGTLGDQVTFTSESLLMLGFEGLLLLDKDAGKQEGNAKEAEERLTPAEQRVANARKECLRQWSPLTLPNEQKGYFPVLQMRGEDMKLNEWLLFDDQSTQLPPNLSKAVLPRCSLPSAGCDPSLPGVPWAMVRTEILKWVGR